MKARINKKKMNHAQLISFSGGRTSAYMAYRLKQENPNEDYIIIFCNTGKEMPETLDFVNECDQRWNLNVIWLEYRKGNQYEVVNYETASRDGRPFDELIEHKKGFLPNLRMRYCTRNLKIDTIRRYLNDQGFSSWSSHVGIRYDEPRRWAKNNYSPEYIDLIHPLVGWKITKKDVMEFWSKQQFDLQINAPYGNCDGCFLKGKGNIIKIASERPDLLDWWIEKEKNNPGQFRKEISYEQLRNIAILKSKQMDLFNQDPDIECFCNVD